jgi:kinase suppressor of Ras 2
MPGSGASAAAVACPDTLAVALRNCEEVEIMIEISAGHLERLRTPKGKNTATSDLTKQEIRTMEGKLIKHFSKQLAIRTAMAKNAALSAPSVEMRAELLKFPSLPQWLNVVGISGESKKAILGRIMTLEQLRDKTESGKLLAVEKTQLCSPLFLSNFVSAELNRLLLSATRLTTTQRNEDLRRLSRSLQSLKQYTAILLHGDSATGGSGKFIPDASKMELHWDSWQQTTTTTAAAMSKTPSADSPKEDDFSSSVHSGSTPMPVTPTSRGFSANRDSAASSLSSNSSAASSLPPPSPGIMGVGGPTGTFSSQPWQSSSASTASSVALLEKCRATPPTTPPWSAAAIFGSGKIPATVVC